jgi:outer membrane receptor protein involved in Fe transport
MLKTTSTAALLVGVFAAGSAFAQAAPAQPADAVAEVVVTGTRVIRDGFQAPTPTSVIGAEEIAKRAPGNIADFVNQLPSLAGGATPKSTGSFTSNGLIGINALNLRNLNPNRTLVLLDGQRVGASSLTGLVDVNQFPQSLVKRVDVVTGGASASWGSDAVAGVVNFVLDKEFTGLKGTVQGGVTDYGDDRNYLASLSAGTRFAGGRGHLMVNGEFAYNEGVTGIGDRKWYEAKKVIFNPTYTATNGQPQLLVRDHVGIAVATPGGLITSGPLRGTYFGPGGTPSQLNFGSVTSGNYFVDGDYRYADYGLAGNLSPKLERQSIFGRASYDVSDHVQVFGQLSYGRSTADQITSPLTQLANRTIQADNAFIPASIASRVTAPFTYGTLNGDLPNNTVYNKRETWRAVAGASGDFDGAGSHWTWDAYAQRSVNNVYNAVETLITANYVAAIDAVRNANGIIVCRSTLTSPTNGCVPLNPFGTGVVSDTSRNYVLGTSWSDSKLTQDVIAATVHGEPFSTWAGPVSIATGLEHRREKVTGSNDPLSTSRAFQVGNYRASFGSFNVTEGFIETVVPLAKDTSFAKNLDFNGAVRATDYSTSGFVTTWKLGLTYKPIDDVTFRATRSRDIRAPNLADLFQTGVASSATIADPFRNNASSTFISTTQGNLGLKPEKADTLGLGVVVQPRFLTGFAASVDYFDIQIDDAIQSVAPALIVSQCFAGNQAFCSMITRSSANVITGITIAPINLAKQINRGLDFEASYRRPAFDGGLTMRVLATRYLKNVQDNGINVPTDTVGKNSADASIAAASGAGATSLPKWRYIASIGYDRDAFGVNLTARGVSKGSYSPAYVECTSGCPASTADNQTIDNNRLKGAVYFDASFTYKLTQQFEGFVVVENLANTDPVQVAYGPNLGSSPLTVNSTLYDVMGRTYRIGLRFKM